VVPLSCSPFIDATWLRWGGGRRGGGGLGDVRNNWSNVFGERRRRGASVRDFHVDATDRCPAIVTNCCTCLSSVKKTPVNQARSAQF